MKAFLFVLISLISLLLASCENYNEKNDSNAALTDSNSITGLTGDSIKIVKNATVDLKVKDIQQSTRAVSNLARKFGGMLFNQKLEFTESGQRELHNSADSITVITVYRPQADITIRVPSENLEEFMFSVTDLGYFTWSTEINMNDKSLEYLENSLKQRNRTETLSGSTTKKDSSFTTYQAIAVKDAAIEQLIRNKSIDADANYSVVNISLFQNPLVTKEVVVNASIAAYNLPFSQRLANSLQDGWKYFLEFILVLTHLWIFILISITVFLFYRSWNHRRKTTKLDVGVK